ncbi:MAG: LPD16 domain-containing protein [Ruthenibacterium lactatiformans]
MDEKEHSIRFINSSYDTLFRIPDGGTVEVQFPDRKFSAKCEYIDDYHTLVGDSVFHICEFAEMVEHQHGSVRPEPETELDQAAWQLGHREYLALQTTDSGYDYTIYSQQFKLMDGGQLDAPVCPSRFRGQ